jgi:hypothetical protein
LLPIKLTDFHTLSFRKLTEWCTIKYRLKWSHEVEIFPCSGHILPLLPHPIQINVKTSGTFSSSTITLTTLRAITLLRVQFKFPPLELCFPVSLSTNQLPVIRPKGRCSTYSHGPLSKTDDQVKDKSESMNFKSFSLNIQLNKVVLPLAVFLLQTFFKMVSIWMHSTGKVGSKRNNMYLPPSWSLWSNK